MNVPAQRTEPETELPNYAGVAHQAVVRVPAGPLPTASVPAFRVTIFDLVDRARGTVIVDLTGTESLDATALAVLVGAARRLSARGGRLLLCQPAEGVVATLVKHGLNRYLPVVSAL